MVVDRVMAKEVDIYLPLGGDREVQKASMETLSKRSSPRTETS